MRRACLIPVLLVALLTPTPALGQSSNPFGPLPQTPQAPPEPPEPQPADRDSGADDGLGGTAFWLIIGSTGALFLGVAIFITRDMRKTAGTRRKPRKLRGTGRPAAAAADSIAAESRHTGSQRARAKAQQRAKVKAARKQRRKSRSR